MTRPAPPDARTTAFREAVADAADRGRRGLLARQEPDGHWVGELEGDTILESEFILLLAFLGKVDDPRVRPAGHDSMAASDPPDAGTD